MPPEDAFHKAFDEYADALLRHASFRVKSRERAVDLTQDTFAKAWDYLASGSEIREWRPFLYRILNNLIIDDYRRKHEQSLDALLEDDAAGMGARLATGGRAESEDRLDEELLIERVRAVIPELPAVQQEVLALRYADGLSPKEIARQLGISENAVSVRIHRAIARLKELCAPFTYL
jgi:RNA polymerase sigma-70 factor (ECF subfamily)